MLDVSPESAEDRSIDSSQLGKGSTASDNRWRQRARRALEGYFEKRSAPRLILSFVLALTGLSGALISFGLLHAGVDRMSIRYPSAVLGAYAVFLGLLRLWVQFEKARFDPDAQDVREALQNDRRPEYVPTWRSTHAESSWLDWLDIPSPLDIDEGCAPVAIGILILALVVGLFGLVFAVIASAPALLAEVFVDAVVVTALYRRLRVAAREHWLGTAVKRTCWKALGAATLLALIGWILDTLVPGTHSIGPAIHRLFG